MRKSRPHILVIFVMILLLSIFACVEKTNSPTITKTQMTNKQLPKQTPIVQNLSPTAYLSPTPSVTPTQQLLIVPDLKMAYTDYDGLYVIRTNGQELSHSELIDTTADDILYRNPVWSPDGSKVAFIAEKLRFVDQIYDYPDIYVVNRDGSNLRQVTFSPQYKKWLYSWSPDGVYLLVSMYRYVDFVPDKIGLYLLDSTDGSVTKRLIDDVGEIARWTSDGKKIIFTNHNNDILYEMNGDGSDIQTVGKIGEPLGELSPDVNLTAFSDNFQCGHIFIREIKGNNPIQVSNTDHSDSFPTWSPDGLLISFLRESTICGVHPSNRWWNIVISDSNGREFMIPNHVAFFSDVKWSPIPALQIDKSYLITDLGANLNLRSEASKKGTVISKLQAGEIIYVLDGPFEKDDYYWWNIRTADGINGWVVEQAYWFEQLEQ